MRWQDYEALSEKTLSLQFHCDQRMQKMLHSVVGMLTEVEEILDNHSMQSVDEVNRAEEWGDLAWYLAILTRELSMDFSTSGPPDKAADPVISMTKSLLRLLDMLKKSIYYGKPFDDDAATQAALRIMAAMSQYATSNGIDTGSALRANIEKLRARYGDRFSSDAAINRDLDRERRVLGDNL